MYISKLPSDIIEKVLQKVSVQKYEWLPKLNNWKRTLPFLAVCRNWRQLAIPYVYAYAALSTNNHDVIGKYNNNIRLIVDAQMSIHTREIIILISRYSKPELVLKTVLKCMATANLKWNKLKTLTIRIECVRNSAAYDIDVLVEEFGHIMPSVTKLTLVDFPFAYSTNLCSRLVDYYAPQLKVMEAILPMQLTAPEFSKNLTKLHLNVVREDYKLVPNVYAKSLRSLRINSLPCNYNWNNIADNEGSEDVVFTNLEKLEIRYKTDYTVVNQLNSPSGETRIRKFCFPKLQNLSLRNATDECYISANGVFPNKMDRISVKGTAGALVSLSLLNHTSEVNILCINQSEFIANPLAAANAVQSVNTIMDNVHAENKCELGLYNFSDQIDTAHLNWPNLTFLTLHNIENASTILQILPQLPKLEEINVHKLNPDAFTINTDIPCNAINQQLKTMAVGLNRMPLPERAIPFVKTVLRYLTSLTSFGVEDFPEKLMNGIIEEYKYAYPHVADIKILKAGYLKL